MRRRSGAGRFPGPKETYPCLETALSLTAFFICPRVRSRLRVAAYPVPEPPRVSDAFEEVDESLRQDKAAELWRRWSPWLIGAAVALILAVGVYQALRYVRAQAVEKDAKAFSTVMDQIQKKDFASAKAGLEKLSTSKTGFAAMADHVLAAVDEDQSKDPAAIAKDLTSAANRKDGLLSDIAQLKLAYIKADTVSLAELKTLVAPLQKTGGPMAALGQELIAAKEAATGDVEAAPVAIIRR